uniref:AlNc14C10G1302 protein n=1 Tax=Albugo laibachii Nc14 TaxID=890382 RepID=F0W2R4_9STRA|nr:AlNc14C10G1302 [Albugo laibachii Nc14]|eukprot:CCA15350.1 AlNc14C10G1302 [Albugo laibachii Nc14]
MSVLSEIHTTVCSQSYQSLDRVIRILIEGNGVWNHKKLFKLLELNDPGPAILQGEDTLRIVRGWSTGLYVPILAPAKPKKWNSMRKHSILGRVLGRILGRLIGWDGTLGRMVIGDKVRSCRFRLRRGDRLNLEE